MNKAKKDTQTKKTDRNNPTAQKADARHEDTAFTKALSFPAVPEELYFGIMRAIGVREEGVVESLVQQLKTYGFTIVQIQLSKWLTALPGAKDFIVRDSPLERLLSMSEVGNWLRKESGSGDALARCAAFEVAIKRQELLNGKTFGVDDYKAPPAKIAYIFRTLVHEEEIYLLRDLYGSRFFCIAVHDTESQRRDNLLSKLKTDNSLDYPQLHLLLDDLLLADKDAVSPAGLPHLRRCTPELVRTIQGSSDKQYRQNVGKAYQLADLFVSPDVRHTELGDPIDHIDRILRLIHGDPFVSPTLDELGMAHAFAAVGASASLARQVGAAVCSKHGDFLTSGYNEVPKPGGGVYGQPSRRGHGHDQVPDARDHMEGGDISDRIRRELFRDLMSRFATDMTWFDELERDFDIELRRGDGKFDDIKDLERMIEDVFSPTSVGGAFDSLIDKVLHKEFIRDAEFFNVIEYGRSVHAEMQAITTAARRGIAIDRSTIYVTTFPCHECTRHIISSGIMRVVYVEPYLKSRALQLHPDAISVTDDTSPTHIWTADNSHIASEPRPGNWPAEESTVQYESFRGLAPRRHHELFSAPPRKLSRRLLEKYSKEGRENEVKRSQFGEEDLIEWDKAAAERRVSNLAGSFQDTHSQGQNVPWADLRRTTRRSVAGDGKGESRRLLGSQQAEELARFMYLKESLDERATIDCSGNPLLEYIEVDICYKKSIRMVSKSNKLAKELSRLMASLTLD